MAYRKGNITKEQYDEFNKNKIAECVALQEEIGLDVPVHGEFERNDMAEYFGECLNGYLFTEKPMTVEWSAYQIALAIRDEVLDLEKNGIRIIQIDEAAFREKLPLRKSDWESDYLDWAIPAFRLVHSGVKAETQIHTHMCYSEFTDIIPAIDNMDADVITFEASRSDLQILDSLKENNFKTQVGPGVYDIHSPRVPSVEEIKSALDKMLEKIPAEKLWINPDCGLKTRGNEETKPSLEHMVEAAKMLREGNE